MNYRRHYDALISRARTRIYNGYTEVHHIIPRCLGGSNDATNLVKLTPEEHYLAHQLLIKIYPDNKRMVHAAMMMAVDTKQQKRINNKLYGWLRRKYQIVCKQRTGKRNGSFGKPWYHNPRTGEAKKFKPGTAPVTWCKGRVSRLVKKECVCCQQIFTGTKKQRYCSDSCRLPIRIVTCTTNNKKRKRPITDTEIQGIIARQEKGELLKDIFVTFEINPATLYDIVARYKRENAGCSSA